MLQIQENYADLIEDVLDELSDIFNFDQPKVKIQPTFLIPFCAELRALSLIFLKTVIFLIIYFSVKTEKNIFENFLKI